MNSFDRKWLIEKSKQGVENEKIYSKTPPLKEQINKNAPLVCRPEEPITCNCRIGRSYKVNNLNYKEK